MRLKTISLAIRTNENNENHHIWKNNGIYFIHYTLHFPDYTKARKRESLGTNDLEIARQRRDAKLNAFVHFFANDVCKTA